MGHGMFSRNLPGTALPSPVRHYLNPTMLTQSATSASFVIHTINESDRAKFMQIRKIALETDPQAFLGTADESESAWKERFENPNWRFFGAEQDDVLIGIAGLDKIGDGIWELVAVYTLPEYRHHGIARNLVTFAIEEAKKMQAKKLTLFVNMKQTDALIIYQGMGFSIVREEENTMADGAIHREYFMEKVLG